MEMTEHIYTGNKIIEYPDGTFTAYYLIAEDDIENKNFNTLEEAEKWLDDNGYSID